MSFDLFGFFSFIFFKYWACVFRLNISECGTQFIKDNHQPWLSAETGRLLSSLFRRAYIPHRRENNCNESFLGGFQKDRQPILNNF
jgi:hypothetical protein